jgi:hypothetical protein
MNDRYVIMNATLITLDPADRRCEALAVSGERILRIGGTVDMKDLIDQGWPVMDLRGQTVLPGFIDTHQHMMLTGSQESAVHLDTARHIDDVVERIAEQAGRTEPGQWIRGSYLNEQTLAQKSMPTCRDLDRAAPDHPVFLMHVTCHMCSLNTRARAILNPPPDLPGLDLAAGRPTGVVRDPGILTFIHPAMGRIIAEEAKVGFLLQAAEMALKKGVTTLHALDGGDFGPGDTPVIWHHRHRLPVRVVCYNQSMDLAEVQALGLPRVGGCICADGAFEAHTAALFEPYADAPDNYGALTYSAKQMDDFVLSAHRQGLQIAVHCESERSIEQVLWAMEKALRAYPRKDHRHRIEHLELPTYNQIARMAAAGIMASMQPAFIPAFIGATDMAKYRALLGDERIRRVHPYRSLLYAGIPISGGSDSPVTPYDPLAGIQAAADHPNPDERVTLTEALRMFTSTAAWSAFEEKHKGSLEAGKLADLVVLAEDPFTVPLKSVKDIAVRKVCVGGRWHEPAPSGATC